ncbi:LuxR C-terminal-related transcriptional regulator [Cohnella fermenti]|uniref:Response regulator transcription factor n=1 Tax=Cohnella fermenti TaxID=2565925 RepID=A0A4S4BKP5_9BACL|nr:response regulator transcription factor [Cohnella fermenti]THF74360.1 response regulator transcription factor [Cohnella fermenti]
MHKINVLLVEQDSEWKRHIETRLQAEPDLCVIGSVHAYLDAIAMARMLDIDVILLEAIGGEQTAWTNAIFEIASLGKTQMIMVAAAAIEEWICEAFVYGVSNYLLKAHTESLVEAIRAAYAHQSAIHYIAAGVVRQELARLKRREWQRQLTESEQAILRLIDSGRTHAQIMNELSIAESTMKTHVNRILRKLKVPSSKEAARQAKMKGIV